MGVVKQSVQEDSMVWPVAEAVRYISVTADSATSYGGHSRWHKSQLSKNRHCLSRKRPDCVTLLLWTKGKQLACDVTVPDIYANSHLADIATTAGTAAEKAASNKEPKNRQLVNSNIFVPVAIDTVGTWNQKTVQLVQEISRRIRAVTEDSRETTYLFHSLSVAWPSNGKMRYPSTAF